MHHTVDAGQGLKKQCGIPYISDSQFSAVWEITDCDFVNIGPQRIVDTNRTTSAEQPSHNVPADKACATSDQNPHWKILSIKLVFAAEKNYRTASFDWKIE
jgi:hypothetical protein